LIQAVFFYISDERKAVMERTEFVLVIMLDGQFLNSSSNRFLSLL